MQNHLKSSSNISETLSKQIFAIRSENFDVDENFPLKYKCKVKCIHESCTDNDGKTHLFED